MLTEAVHLFKIASKRQRVGSASHVKQCQDDSDQSILLLLLFQLPKGLFNARITAHFPAM